MLKPFIAPAAAIILLIYGPGSQNTPDIQTFYGEISDSLCASVGSHDAMMEKVEADTAKACAQECERTGARYVLYDKNNRIIYQLDNQTKPETLAGEMVIVTGTYDTASKTIHVTDIVSAITAPQKP